MNKVKGVVVVEVDRYRLKSGQERINSRRIVRTIKEVELLASAGKEAEPAEFYYYNDKDEVVQYHRPGFRPVRRRCWEGLTWRCYQGKISYNKEEVVVVGYTFDDQLPMYWGGSLVDNNHWRGEDLASWPWVHSYDHDYMVGTKNERLFRPEPQHFEIVWQIRKALKQEGVDQFFARYDAARAAGTKVKRLADWWAVKQPNGKWGVFFLEARDNAPANSFTEINATVQDVTDLMLARGYSPEAIAENIEIAQDDIDFERWQKALFRITSDRGLSKEVEQLCINAGRKEYESPAFKERIPLTVSDLGTIIRFVFNRLDSGDWYELHRQLSL